jgi:hypothetical protein
MPKQFVPLLGTQSTFQQTLQRVADRGEFAGPVIATNEKTFTREDSWSDYATLPSASGDADIGLACSTHYRAERLNTSHLMYLEAIPQMTMSARSWFTPQAAN